MPGDVGKVVVRNKRLNGFFRWRAIFVTKEVGRLPDRSSASPGSRWRGGRGSRWVSVVLPSVNLHAQMAAEAPLILLSEGSQPFGAWVCHGPRPGRVLPRRRSCHSSPRAECRNFRGDAGRASGRCGHCRQAVQAAGESDCGSFSARAAANGISGARNQDAMARSWMICCASRVCADPGTGQQKAPRAA
jgi:hypothetical protein